jgi:hypothetical protein
MRELVFLLCVLPLTAQTSNGPGVPAGGVSGMGHSGPDWVASLSQDRHFKKVLENAAVMVWQLELNPGESTLLDRYGHDFLEVVIQSGSMSMADERGHLTPLLLKPGALLIRGGFAQVLKNTDQNARFRGVFVEFRSPLGAERCGPEAPAMCPGGGVVRHLSLGIVETDHLYARRYFMGASVHLPELVIAIKPARLVASGVSAGTRLLKAGEVAWLTSGVESVQGPDPSAIVDFVGVEFKGAP